MRKPINKLFGLGRGLTVIVVTLWAWSGHRVSAAQPPDPVLQAFGMIGITNGQTAQVDVSNARLISPPDPIVPVDVEIFFLDGDGSVMKQTTLRLPNGRSASLSVNADEFLRGTGRLQLRALVRFQQPPEPVRGDNDRRQDRSEPVIVSSVEVIDIATNKTNFVLQAPPDPVRNQH